MMRQHTLFFMVLVFAFASCKSNEAFTNKVTAPTFVSQLYSSTENTILVNHSKDSHITWMGLIESNDYRYFEVTKVQVGSEVIVQDGVESNGETYVANSNSIVEDISVSATSEGSGSFADGTIAVTGANDLKITVKYSPLKEALASDPHDAYLVLYYDEPEVGAVRIQLQGETDGVNEQKCTHDVATMTPMVYAFKNNSFNFYLCAEEVVNKGQNNIASLSVTDPDYHGQSTNLTPVSTLGIQGQQQYQTFYKVDDTTVCLLSSDLSQTDPSIPNFTFLIPEGLAPIDDLTIGMSEGSFAECSLTETGTILCDEDILIETGVVPVSALSATNGSFTAEETTTSVCSDFGPLNGSGVFGDDAFTLVLKGTMLRDSNTVEFNIVDALVAAQIELECVSGCE